jgi:hypothetical protein
MDQIILQAKVGPPVSRIVGGDIMVEKAIRGSIIEKHKGANRRLRGKQSMQASVAHRQLNAAVDKAKNRTKAEGEAILKRAVDGLEKQMNKEGKRLSDNYRHDVDATLREIVKLRAGKHSDDQTIAKMTNRMLSLEIERLEQRAGGQD